MLLLVSLTPPQDDIARAIGWLAAAALAGTLAHRAVYFLLGRWCRRTMAVSAGAAVRHTHAPAALLFPLVCMEIARPNLTLHEPNAPWRGALAHALAVAMIAALAWGAMALVTTWAEILLAHHRVDVEDNLLARQVGTRVSILARVTNIAVVIVGIAIALMTFPSIRAIGTGLLASAGAAGIVIGLAARPLFENLIAGIQLALTEPIRLDDVIVVNGYWGRIEEIRSTFVIIRVWDLRRLVVPLSWFIQNPFENWTRSTANLIGEVTLFADWTLDVEALRAAVPELLARTPLWDGRVQNCQVIDATDRAIQVRILVSARNSGDLWDLRCFAREAIVGYLRDKQPHALPAARFERAEREPGGQIDAPRASANEVQRIRTASS